MVTGCIRQILPHTQNKRGAITGESVTAQSIFEVVKYYGALRSPCTTPVARSPSSPTGQGAVEQIRLSLGHASIETTERYLYGPKDPARCDARWGGPGVGDTPQETWLVRFISAQRLR